MAVSVSPLAGLTEELLTDSSDEKKLQALVKRSAVFRAMA